MNAGWIEPQRGCANCAWYTEDLLSGWSCSSLDSRWCGDWPGPDDCCECWEECDEW